MKNALLVIDVQEYFLNEHTKDLPQKIADFIQRNKFDHVLFFKFVNTKDSNWVKSLGWHKMLAAPQTKIASALKEFLNKDNTFIKRAAFSVFRSKKFNKFVKDQEISELFVCGMDTDACIYTTAMEAFERKFAVKVIDDLCAASHGKEYHQNTIASLKRNLGEKVIVNSMEF